MTTKNITLSDEDPYLRITSDSSFLHESILYHSLILFSIYDDANKIKKYLIIRRIKKNIKILKNSNRPSIDIHINKVYLLEGLIAHLEKNNEKAIKFLDKSILAANEKKLYKDATIANRLAAHICVEMGNSDIGKLYLISNDTEPDRFSNKAVIQHSGVSAVIESGFNRMIMNSTPDAIDLTTVIKATQIISAEIILENLIEKLMTILLENAGAETMFLLLENKDGLYVKSITSPSINDIKIRKSTPSENPDHIPLTIINYVKRTMEPLVLGNAVSGTAFSKDPYILSNSIRSVLCIPLIQQNNLKGIVYLENRLTADAFTSDRIEIIKLISTQATISIENSLLFEKKKQNEMELQQQYEEIQSQYEEMETLNEELSCTTSELLHANDTLAIFKKFAEESGLGMGMTDLNGYITYTNPSLCRMLNYTSSDMLTGMLLEQFYPEEISLRIKNEILPGIKTGKDWAGEVMLLSHQGKLTPAIQSFFTIKDNAGSPVVIATIITDITERKQLEQQLFQSQKMEAVGTLAGGIAHDFNNLLTAIMGFSELIVKDMTPDDPHFFDINEIIKAANRSASLTRQLLAFSRKQILKPGILDLNQVVRDMEKMLNRLVGEDVRLFTLLMDGLDKVQADLGQIEQVIMNLIINARDAMPAGGTISIITENKTIDENSVITIPDSKCGNFVCLSIKDTGTGIGPDDIGRIFEPFFSTKGPERGTGLGLSVVYGITAQHNGWINVKSNIDIGTIFDIYLPSVTDETAETVPFNKERSIKRGNGERILLIEDQKEILNFATKALKGFGYTVTGVSSGKNALEAFDYENGNFDLVFTDVVLPDINGTQIISYIKNKKPDIPVLFSSGYTDQKSQWEIIRDNDYHFLEKPYPLDILLTTIYEIINSGK